MTDFDSVSHLFSNECYVGPLHPECCHGDVLVAIAGVCNTIQIMLLDQVELGS